jgi:hypothetical protein
MGKKHTNPDAGLYNRVPGTIIIIYKSLTHVLFADQKF